MRKGIGIPLICFLLLLTGCGASGNNGYQDVNRVSETIANEYESELEYLRQELQQSKNSLEQKELTIKELNGEINGFSLQIKDLNSKIDDLSGQLDLQNNAAIKGEQFFSTVRSMEKIGFYTEEKDYEKIGCQFLEEYGDLLLLASKYYPLNEYAISGFITVKAPTLHEAEIAKPKIVENGVIFTL